MAHAEIERITVRIGETLIDLRPDEARELVDKLGELLGHHQPAQLPLWPVVYPVVPIVIERPPTIRPYWTWEPPPVVSSTWTFAQGSTSNGTD